MRLEREQAKAAQAAAAAAENKEEATSADTKPAETDTPPDKSEGE